MRTPNKELMGLTPGATVLVIEREQVVYETKIKSVGKRIVTETEYGGKDQWHLDGFAYGKGVYNHRKIVTRDPESKQS
jgi:TPP-dependent indolepyruvate ferredoxin oxidoreductase alpha subunit